ncbi:DUF3108 domain-containing protein [Pelomonas sp. KK5]|uniref:DUF3108 domain-containing protein n=1 Tax=Pelomonas sp. KK5 TaxID=1855730 RepID=UPI0009FAD155|nr:DUF3108 domain-containing protein [Pelomonas sp. KK5]
MAARRLRAALAAGLAAAVLLAHLAVISQLPGGDWRAMAPLPPPLNVSFVRPMQVQAAKPAARPFRRMPLPSNRTEPAPVEPPQTPLESAVGDELLAGLPPLAPDLGADVEPGPEWPLSTRLSYRLSGNFRGPVSGHSSVEWQRQGSRYQVRLVVAVGPKIAPLVSRAMVSEGQLTPQGIAPQRFDEDTRVLFAPRQRRTLRFEPQRITFPDGRDERAPAGLQDSASQFVQLTWLFLTGRQQMRPGLVVELPLALPRRQYLWGYRVLGEERLDTPLGRLAAWHLQPTRAPGGGDLVAEVWLAPSLQYLPVRLLIREDGENFVDLMLDEAPLQEAPIVQPSEIKKESTAP